MRQTWPLTIFLWSPLPPRCKQENRLSQLANSRDAPLSWQPLRPCFSQSDMELVWNCGFLEKDVFEFLSVFCSILYRYPEMYVHGTSQEVCA